MKEVPPDKLDFTPILADEIEFKWGMTLWYHCPENRRTFGPAVFSFVAKPEELTMFDEESIFWGGKRWSLRYTSSPAEEYYLRSCSNLYASEIEAWQAEHASVNWSMRDHERRLQYYKGVLSQTQAKLDELRKKEKTNEIPNL